MFVDEIRRELMHVSAGRFLFKLVRAGLAAVRRRLRPPKPPKGDGADQA
jgi:hypothetical protein